jgi:D-alanyl-D-alanine carboxypeptidase
MKKLVVNLLLVSIVLFPGCLSSGHGKCSASGSNIRVEKELDKLIPNFLNSNKEAPVNNIIVYLENEHSKLIYHKAFGFRNEEKTVPAEKHEIFKTGSSSKTFTAAVVMQMAEEGKLLLIEPISKYIGDSSFVNFNRLHMFNGKPYGRMITVAQALSHTSGVSDLLVTPQFMAYATNHPQQQWIPKELFERYYEFGLNAGLFIPGTPGKFNYSDVNYFLLGLLIERISGNSYQQEVRKRILILLQMSDTYFEYREPKSTPNEFVETFFKDINVTRNINTSFDWSGGGYATTVLDFRKFIVALMSNKLFERSETLKKMIVNYGGLGAAAHLSSGYGYGVDIFSINGAIYYGHGGFWGTYMLYSPKKKITLCLSVGQHDADRVKLVSEIIKLVDY